jgi:phage shock protein PspC (stress-responsive transcriptional regulator)
MTRRLYRRKTGKILGGVAGGLADYLEVDPVWVRLFFLLTALVSGVGVIIYLVMWWLAPEADEPVRGASTQAGPQPGTVIGAILLGLGLLFLLQNLGLPWLGGFHPGALWPLLLIAFGGIAVWRVVNES